MNNNKGSILITTSWIVAILSLLAVGVGFRASLDLRLSKYQFDTLKARYLAKAGIEKAMDLLSKDDNDYDSFYECGVVLKGGQTLESLFKDENNKLKTGAFSVSHQLKLESGDEKVFYGIIDEERKFNINMEKSVSGNPVEFRRILSGLSPNMTDEVISCIIDWQDTNVTVEPPDGVEEGAKNSNFESLEELHLVKSMTPELFNEIKDLLTVQSSGKINMNTAPEAVLKAVIEDGSGVYSGLIEKIVNDRKGEDDIEGTEDDRHFASLSDIESTLSLEENEKARLATLASFFVFKSEYFNIKSEGRSAKITKTMTWIVKKSPGAGKQEIVYSHEE